MKTELVLMGTYISPHRRLRRCKNPGLCNHRCDDFTVFGFVLLTTRPQVSAGRSLVVFPSDKGYKTCEDLYLAPSFVSGTPGPPPTTIYCPNESALYLLTDIVNLKTVAR